MKWAPKTGPRAKVYNGAEHPARGGAVQSSRNGDDTRQPTSSGLRWKRLKAARRIASYPVSTTFIPTRFEPGNGNCWKTVPASSVKHGSAQNLQHPPGRTVHSRCLHSLPARCRSSSPVWPTASAAPTTRLLWPVRCWCRSRR